MQRTLTPIHNWCKQVKKELIDRDIGIKELAEAIGISRTYTSDVVNGVRYSSKMFERISSYLGIAPPHS